ncbi:MAG: hypothetical protein QW128_06035 [Thermoprotei archaeon]
MAGIADIIGYFNYLYRVLVVIAIFLLIAYYYYATTHSHASEKK